MKRTITLLILAAILLACLFFAYTAGEPGGVTPTSTATETWYDSPALTATPGGMGYGG